MWRFCARADQFGQGRKLCGVQAGDIPALKDRVCGAKIWIKQ